MSRRSILRKFKRFGRKIKHGFQKAGHWIVKHKKLLLALGIGTALAATPLGSALGKLLSSLGRSIVSNPGTALKVAGGVGLAYGAVKGTKALSNTFSNNKSLILGSVGFLGGYILYKKMR